MLKDLFTRLGLSQKEMDVFLQLLELGAKPVSVLAKHLGMPRSSTYLVLDKLKKLNLVDEFERMGVKYVKCIPARNLDDVLKSREREIEHTRYMLAERMPELEALESKLSITPKVRFIEGADAVLHMYGEIFKHESFCAFFDPSSVKRIEDRSHYQMPKYIGQTGGMARELAVHSADAFEYKELFENENHHIKILPQHMHFTSDFIITKDVLYLIAYGEMQVSATEMWSPSLVNTAQVMFDSIWEIVE